MNFMYENLVATLKRMPLRYEFPLSHAFHPLKPLQWHWFRLTSSVPFYSMKNDCIRTQVFKFSQFDRIFKRFNDRPKRAIRNCVCTKNDIHIRPFAVYFEQQQNSTAKWPTAITYCRAENLYWMLKILFFPKKSKSK